MADAKTHKGSCHRGGVTFEAETNLEPVIECNCTHCYRKGLLLAFVTPDAFRLKRGEDRLSEYLFNKHIISHRFCKTCGVEVFGMGKGPDGQPMSYSLDHKEGGTRLREEQTLPQARVNDGDHLIVYPEIVAG